MFPRRLFGRVATNSSPPVDTLAPLLAAVVRGVQAALLRTGTQAGALAFLG